MIKYEKLRNYINRYQMRLSTINRLSDEGNIAPCEKIAK